MRLQIHAEELQQALYAYPTHGSDIRFMVCPAAAGTVANRYTPCVGKDAIGPRRPRGPALYARLGTAGTAAVVAQAMQVMESVEP